MSRSFFRRARAFTGRLKIGFFENLLGCLPTFQGVFQGLYSENIGT
jgi:hypothetical protein